MTTTKRAPARTAQQIAQDKVDKAQARLNALGDQAEALRSKLEEVESKLAIASKKLRHALLDPDLEDADPAQTSIDDVLDEEPLPEGGEPA